MIFELGNNLVSEEILTENFLCDLLACKGACCVEGDDGAPLEAKEIEILEKEIENIKPFLTDEGLKVIDEKGLFVKDSDNEEVTPLMKDATCAYALRDDQGILKCGIEQAYLKGETNFRKPISCHLYPIRVSKLKEKDALVYHRWDICSPACKNGDQQKVPLVEFAKAALVRKYGQDFYDEILMVYNEYKKTQ